MHTEINLHEFHILDSISDAIDVRFATARTASVVLLNSVDYAAMSKELVTVGMIVKEGLCNALKTFQIRGVDILCSDNIEQGKIRVY